VQQQRFVLLQPQYVQSFMAISLDPGLSQVVEKKANIVGIKTLSDAERAQMRAAK